jgi:hypothetical protein
MRHLVAEQVEAVDLMVDGRLLLLVDRVDELADGLDAIRVAVVDGLEMAHGAANAKAHGG